MYGTQVCMCAVQGRTDGVHRRCRGAPTWSNNKRFSHFLQAVEYCSSLQQDKWCQKVCSLPISIIQHHYCGD